jgi:hypothetical protein
MAPWSTAKLRGVGWIGISKVSQLNLELSHFHPNFTRTLLVLVYFKAVTVYLTKSRWLNVFVNYFKFMMTLGLLYNNISTSDLSQSTTVCKKNMYLVL